MTTWMRAVVWTLLGSALAHAQSPIPKDLEGWQAWVQDGREFQLCPFFANTDGSRASNRICAWPGRLNLELTQGGGHFTQTWVNYGDAWVPLPGNLEHWPRAVTINGAAAAVVSRDGIPQIRAAQGTFALAGSFAWTRRPDSLPIPAQTGLVTLSLDGHALDPADRPDGAVWLGKRREAEVAQQLDVQVYRLLRDEVPALLTTRLNLKVAGDAREETLSRVLPEGFQLMSLDSELPARIDAEGSLRIQVRAGSWTVSVNARAAADVGKITIPVAHGLWPKQEIWSYAADDRLRVAALEGAEGIDPAQANVPPEWRQFASYRIAPGDVVHIVERSRGAPQEGNHLSLQRELYLDFAHQGFTVIDRITGQMRSAWRLDMREPYRLLSAASGGDNLLVTKAESAALSGVELRSPTLNLSTVARIAVPGGAMAAGGWTERFDHVAGVLNLPPGHRLVAAFGADGTPGAWVERWGLLDLFLLLIVTVITLRLFGRVYAVVAFAGVALVHQDDPLLAWLILSVLLAIASLKAMPSGRPSILMTWARNLLLGMLLVVAVPFAISQLRFALYPQLADLGGYAPDEVARREAPAMASPAAPAMSKFVPKERAKLEEVVVTGATRSEPPQRYAAGTLVQAGPGVPHWRYSRYPFSWSGPVDPTQSVHFMVLPPWAVGLWRVLGVALLAVLFARLARGSIDFKTQWRVLPARGAAASLVLAALACAMPCGPSHAASTPDRELLNELKTRLARPPKCVPNCAEIMAARMVMTPTLLEANLDVAALSSVAVALPSAGQRFEPDAISLDGVAVTGVYRDDDQQIWIALKPGVHSIKMNARLPAADSIQLLFPQVPRAITVAAEGWDVSGVNAGKLLGNTIELLRRHAAGHDADTLRGDAQFPPYVRIHREFTLGLDWSLQTTVERLAPEKGGFTLEIPLLAGESVLTGGIETRNGTGVLAGFESSASEFSWRSAVPHSDTLTLTAAKDRPWSEVWSFSVSPTWRVSFTGVPAVVPENVNSGDWTFEYFPRAGETLSLTISRPLAAPGGTLAIDNVSAELDVGKRSTNTTLQLSYRSTQGGRHTIGLPAGARVAAVSVDGETVPVRPEKGQLPLALSPGAHRVQIKWQSSEGAALRTRVPEVDLQVPSSNVSTVVHMPSDSWVLYARGSGVGPAILYWGELLVFLVVAIALGRSRRTPLRSYEWLLLGLGLSTFSWSVFLLFVLWMYAMRWREGFAMEQLTDRKFNLLQFALIILSLATVVSLVAAIPFGLLAYPDMRIAGLGQSANELRWFDDQSPGALPTPWVLSLSLWWYKAAMLLWALWLALALVRWLPIAWHALSSGGFWRKTQRAPVPPPPAGG